MDHGKIKYPGVFPLSLEFRWLTLATSIVISDTIVDPCDTWEPQGSTIVSLMTMEVARVNHLNSSDSGKTPGYFILPWSIRGKIRDAGGSPLTLEVK